MDLLFLLGDAQIQILPQADLERDFLGTWTFTHELDNGGSQSASFDLRDIFIKDFTATQGVGQTTLTGTIEALPASSTLYPNGWFPPNYYPENWSDGPVDLDWHIDVLPIFGGAVEESFSGTISSMYFATGELGTFTETWNGTEVRRFVARARRNDGLGELYAQANRGFDEVRVLNAQVTPNPFFPEPPYIDPDDPDADPIYSTVEFYADIAAPAGVDISWTVDVVGEDGAIIKQNVEAGGGTPVFAEWNGLDETGNLAPPQNARFSVNVEACSLQPVPQIIVLDRNEQVLAQTLPDESCTFFLVAQAFGLGQDPPLWRFSKFGSLQRKHCSLVRADLFRFTSGLMSERPFLTFPTFPTSPRGGVTSITGSPPPL